MVEQWTGDLVGIMHKYGITHKQLADQLGMTREYVSMVLNGHRKPAGAEERFRSALFALMEKRQGETLLDNYLTDDIPIVGQLTICKEATMNICKKYCSRFDDMEMEAEIARLEASPYVKLARMYDAVREARQQYLLELLKLESKGMTLEEKGVTAEALERFLPDCY